MCLRETKRFFVFNAYVSLLAIVAASKLEASVSRRGKSGLYGRGKAGERGEKRGRNCALALFSVDRVSAFIAPLVVLAINVFSPKEKRIHVFLLRSAIRTLLPLFLDKARERTRLASRNSVQNRDAISRFPVKLRPRNTPARKFTTVRKFVYAYCNAPAARTG